MSERADAADGATARRLVGIVIVSHSAGLATGLCEVVAQMAPGVAIRPAGGTVDGGIGMPADGAQIPPLVGDAPPLRTRQKPRALLAAHVARELDERLRIARIRPADSDHGTTIP